MHPAWLVVLLGLSALPAAGIPTAASLAGSLQTLSLDADRICRVRDLAFSRGDVKFYLTEGILSFVRPVEGRRVAAVFTTTGAEGGDAEVLAFPSRRSERASLLKNTKSPNLDEHFTFAVFVFSDDTAEELAKGIGDSACKIPGFSTEVAPQIDRVIPKLLSELDLLLVRALLNGRSASNEFFYAALRGSALGNFNILYDPSTRESTTIGSSDVSGDDSAFRLWTAFRPRQAPSWKSPPSRFGSYEIDATVETDLRFSATAAFDYVVTEGEDRALEFGLSNRLQVSSAAIDGTPVEVFERKVARPSEEAKPSGAFLLVAQTPLQAGTTHRISVAYGGDLIRQPTEKTYLVHDRNTWYPYFGNMMASFDLRFRCPEALSIISTGEPVSQKVENGVRFVQRKTTSPQALAGFNVGKYELVSRESGPYRIESYANAARADQAESVAKQTEEILAVFSKRWNALPLHSIAVSPVPGYFGQGFPGLIYLSDVSYTPLQDRPAFLRSARMDSFFSSMLLPHEVAHQWWGSLLVAEDYRSGWLIEAMANDSALEYLRGTQGREASDAVLEQYRLDLLNPETGGTTESMGPVDFGVRLLESSGLRTWHVITYEKGSWILHMLRERLGDGGYLSLQKFLLNQYKAEAINNEEFREAAARFVPAGQPDRDLRLFFDTWVYGTGIPHIEVKANTPDLVFAVSRVDEAFTADLPITCSGKDGKIETRWVRAVAGENAVPLAGKVSCSLPSPGSYLYLR